MSVLAFAGPVRADEILLVNGDRLTGTILKMEEGDLSLATTYGGQIKIRWTEIQRFSSENPLTIEVEDGSQLRGTVQESETGALQIFDPETGAPRRIPFNSIKAINPPPAFRYEGDTSIGGNVTTGNTKTKAVNASTSWKIRTGSHAVIVEGKYNYAESEDEVTARNARAALNYGYLFTDELFFNLEELIEQDTFQELTIRSTTDGGLGYRFVDSSGQKLLGIAGVGFVYSEFKEDATTKNPTATWKVRWEFALVPDKVKAFHTQQGFRDFGSSSQGFRFNADQGLKITMDDNLYLNLAFDYRFNSDPEPGRKKSDQSVIFGVGWQAGN